MSEIDDLSDLTRAQLVAAYNAAQTLLGRGEDSWVKKFRDGNAALKKVSSLRDELLQMHGYAVLSAGDDGKVEWSTQPPPPPPALVDLQKSADSRKIMTNLPLSKSLTLLVSTNPKRTGTRAWKTFEIYFGLPGVGTENPPTGDDYVEAMLDAGFDRKLALSTLHWDTDHGFLRLGEAEDGQES